MSLMLLAASSINYTRPFPPTNYRAHEKEKNVSGAIVLPSARMRSEGTVVGSVCLFVCLLLYISPLECLFVSKKIPSI